MDEVFRDKDPEVDDILRCSSYLRSFNGHHRKMIEKFSTPESMRILFSHFSNARKPSMRKDLSNLFVGTQNDLITAIIQNPSCIRELLCLLGYEGPDDCLSVGLFSLIYSKLCFIYSKEAINQFLLIPEFYPLVLKHINYISMFSASVDITKSINYEDQVYLIGYFRALIDGKYLPNHSFWYRENEVPISIRKCAHVELSPKHRINVLKLMKLLFKSKLPDTFYDFISGFICELFKMSKSDEETSILFSIAKHLPMIPQIQKLAMKIICDRAKLDTQLGVSAVKYLFYFFFETEHIIKFILDLIFRAVMHSNNTFLHIALKNLLEKIVGSDNPLDISMINGIFHAFYYCKNNRKDIQLTTISLINIIGEKLDQYSETANDWSIKAASFSTCKECDIDQSIIDNFLKNDQLYSEGKFPEYCMFLEIETDPLEYYMYPYGDDIDSPIPKDNVFKIPFDPTWEKEFDESKIRKPEVAKPKDEDEKKTTTTLPHFNMQMDPDVLGIEEDIDEEDEIQSENHIQVYSYSPSEEDNILLSSGEWAKVAEEDSDLEESINV